MSQGSGRPVREFPIGPFHESATRWLTELSSDVRATPSPAATVMLVRGEPLEVFMIERAATMDFAPSTWVFPGGRVDPQDDAVVAAGLLEPFDPAALSTALNVDAPKAGALVVAALRELFEEAGVLLVDAPDASSDAAMRGGLEAHRMSFAEVLEGRRLRADLIAPVDRWVTPPFEQRRFDTWFFTALLPEGMSAEAVSRESQRGLWVRPEAMLAEMEAGTVRLLPPTRTALERLKRARGANEALHQARACSFSTTHPVAVMGEHGPYLRAEVNL